MADLGYIKFKDRLAEPDLVARLRAKGLALSATGVTNADILEKLEAALGGKPGVAQLYRACASNPKAYLAGTFPAHLLPQLCEAWLQDKHISFQTYAQQKEQRDREKQQAYTLAQQQAICDNQAFMADSAEPALVAFIKAYLDTDLTATSLTCSECWSKIVDNKAKLNILAIAEGLSIPRQRMYPLLVLRVTESNYIRITSTLIKIQKQANKNEHKDKLMLFTPIDKTALRRKSGLMPHVDTVSALNQMPSSANKPADSTL